MYLAPVTIQTEVFQYEFFQVASMDIRRLLQTNLYELQYDNQ